jgi:cell division protein FtsQ
MNPTLKNILRWTILVVLLAYLGGILVWARAEAERDSCRGVTISMGEKGLSDTITVRGVKSELMKYPRRIVGAPLRTVNTLDIEKYLMSLNNFEDVHCFLSTNGFLNVRITPMIPEIRVFDGNKSYYVNKDGKQINSNAEFFADVPVVSGNFRAGLKPQIVLPVVRFVQKDPVLRDLVAMYEVNGPDDIILVPRITGHVINLGDTTRLAEKRRMLMTAYKNIIPYRGWNQYDTISVKFRGQIVATRRNKAPLYPIETFIEEEDPEEATLPAEVAANNTATSTPISDTTRP